MTTRRIEQFLENPTKSRSESCNLKDELRSSNSPADSTSAINGPDYWTFENAALSVQKAANWDDKQTADFVHYLMQEVKNGALPAYDPRTMQEYKQLPGELRPAVDIVDTDAISECLVCEEFTDWSGEPVEWTPRKSRLDSIVSPRDSRPWESLDDSLSVIDGLFLYQQAAREIADSQGWSDSLLVELLKTMAAAISAKEITVRHPGLGVDVQPVEQEHWFVTVEDVNDWLQNKGAVISYRWNREGISSTRQTDIDAGFTSRHPATIQNGHTLKRVGLVKKYLSIWPSIESDLNHASENGLSAAAKAIKHGDWYELATLAWAEQRGKIEVVKPAKVMNSIFNLPGNKYTKD